MYRALAFKELRETWWTGAIAAIVLCSVVWEDVGLNGDFATLRITWRPNRIPFQYSDIQSALPIVAACLAVVLGLWQTLGESVRGTWRFLRQRPIPLPRLLLVKMGAGLALLYASTAIPFGLYLAWAVSERMHSSPFVWRMALPTCLAWLAASAVYLASFLVGIREARWYGSRLWPLAPAFLLMLLVTEEPQLYAAKLTALADGLLLAAILYVARERND